MVAAATKHTGQQALLLRFDEIDFADEFDGIWACGSLVHVARRDLHTVFSRFSRALKPNAVIYLSFKCGDTERMEEERFFNDMNEATLGLFLVGHPELKLVHQWITEDLRNYARGYQNVLNALVRRNEISESRGEAPGRASLYRVQRESRRSQPRTPTLEADSLVWPSETPNKSQPRRSTR